MNLASDGGRSNRTITAEKVVIAVGTFSTMPPVVYADGRLVFVGDDVLNLPDLPRTLAIVGAGPIGLEYCSTFAELGVRVTLVNMAARILPFADDELVDTLIYHLRQRDVNFRLSEEVFDIEYMRDGLGDRVRVMLVSGNQIVSDAVMYCVGRTGSTSSLNLEAAGLEADPRGPPASGRQLSDQRSGHLCGGRGDRFPQPGFDLGNAGPPRCMPRLWELKPTAFPASSPIPSGPFPRSPWWERRRPS